MGVTGLWSILEPVRETVPLYSLAGKTLAVDLSLWVCEAQSVKEMTGRVAKPHLRNLFFRVSALSLMGIKLIFVMEGEAPKIKADTMSKRTELRFGRSNIGAARTSRSRFNFVLKECSEMLDCLGVPWVTARGEAEAMCAFLDSTGSVDGCITNDGDVFLYGGQTVYRNFNMNTKDPQVDCYRMERIHSELHLERETLVGLAILLGCDYIPKGIPGAGKEQTLKLIETLNGQTLLQKFRQWTEGFEEVQKKAVKKVTHCLVCRHPGCKFYFGDVERRDLKWYTKDLLKVTSRVVACCVIAHSFVCPRTMTTPVPVNGIKLNIFGRSVQKALATIGFPFTEIINEYLVPKDRLLENVKRRKPNLLLMQTFALEKMEWPKHYTSEKVLVLMTYTDMMNITHGSTSSSQLQPLRINKSRIKNGIASFEVVWKKPDHYVHADDHPEEGRHVVTTVEEESLFRYAYPEVVGRFLNEKAEAELRKKHRNRRKEARPAVSEDVSDLLSAMTLQCSSKEKAPSASQDPTLRPGDSTSTQKGPGPSDRSQPSEQGHLGSGAFQRAAVKGSEQPETPAPSGHVSATSCSPSVATAIEELHLSNIDWGASSFTASPLTQGCERSAPPRAEGFVGQDSAQECSHVSASEGETGAQCSHRPAGLCRAKPSNVQPVLGPSQSPLRNRVLVRNATELGVLQHGDAGLVARVHQSECLYPVQDSSQGPRQPDINKLSSTSVLLEQSQMHIKKEMLRTTQKVSQTLNSNCPDSQLQSSNITSQNAKDKCASTNPLPKHRFVKTDITSRRPQQNKAEPGDCTYRDRKIQAIKERVCVSLISSSDESDAENILVDTWQKAKMPKSRPKFSYPIKYQLETAGKTPFQIKENVDIEEAELEAVNSDGDCRRNRLVKDRNVISAEGFTDRSQLSASQQCGGGDDSVISVDSPLPLAERLKLKFMHSKVV